MIFYLFHRKNLIFLIISIKKEAHFWHTQNQHESKLISKHPPPWTRFPGDFPPIHPSPPLPSPLAWYKVAVIARGDGRRTPGIFSARPGIYLRRCSRLPAQWDKLSRQQQVDADEIGLGPIYDHSLEKEPPLSRVGGFFLGKFSRVGAGLWVFYIVWMCVFFWILKGFCWMIWIFDFVKCVDLLW